MRIFNKEIKGKDNSHRKHSLIRIIYLYPVVFFIVGLSAVTAYYTWLQIFKYRNQVDKIKTEFPEKQRNDLKNKVLELKDYIYWVKSHQEDHIIQHLNNRISAVEAVLENFPVSKELEKDELSDALSAKLDELNKMSVHKIILLSKNKEVYYPAYPFNPKNSNRSSRLLNGGYKLADIKTVNQLIRKYQLNKKNNEPYLVFRNISNTNIIIGITFQPDQLNTILQEVVLDSLSKVKYSNNEYIIINTFNGFALLSKGKRQVPPLSINNSSETNWKDIFKKELEFAKMREGGYLTYFWRNQPGVERSEKTSYFSGINDWEWIIGTGFFTSDIDPIVRQLKSELWREITNNLIRFLIFLVILNVLAYLIIRYFALKAKSNILLFLHFFKRAAQGMQIIDSSKLAFIEFDTLAQAANQMIQERERIKSVLSAEKSRLRYMIDAIPDLIFFKDVESKFLGCNKAFEKYINKKSDEIIGFSEFDLFHKTDASGYLKSDQQIIETLVPERTTNWIEYTNGHRFLFYTLKTPYFDSDNNLLGIIGISRDITEMEETRQRLIMAKEKAEESDRLKTAFLANMSHEIRTPMNAIIGFSDLLSEEDLSQEDKADFISKIKIAGRSLMTLINDIIDIAKIEAGQLKISESACDINQILTDLLGTFEEMKNASGKKGISLNLVLPEEKNRVIALTDPMRLQQIFSNLLSNALKFTEFGSIEFGYNNQNNTLSFYVKDSGIGILRSKQKLLFQRFSQLDPSTTRKYGGTGLGLAISKNLVDLLGGSIGMESNPGKGSLFYFTLPYKPVKNQPPVKIAKIDLQNINWEGKTILIAEDMMQNYLLLEALLKRSSVRLLHALNGQIAVDIVRTEPDIDLILMDIQLPLKTGYEALKEILEIRPDIPVMSYTAFALPHEREKSLNAGFVDFIPKPIKAETLIPMLDKYLQNQD
ncbi:MAG: cache domain-containing protein [Bacteroidales bacterium]|nr:cache domain-containing protein [Bacteroidales bacterium]